MALAQRSATDAPLWDGLIVMGGATMTASSEPGPGLRLGLVMTISVWPVRLDSRELEA